MSGKDEVTSMALRVTIDSFEEIIGRGGKNAILNYAGFKELITSPPDYDDKKMVPRAFLNGMVRASSQVIGESGTRTIVARAGKNAIKHLVTHNPNLKGLADNAEMSGADKLKALLNYYSTIASRPPLFEVGEKMASYRVPDCTLCEGFKTEKSTCTYVAGVFEGFARYIAGFTNARCEEVDCKATGDKECVYEIYYEGPQE